MDDSTSILEKLLDMSLYEVIIILLFNTLLFSECISGISILNYLDEFVTCGLVIAFLVKLFNTDGALNSTISKWGIVAAFSLAFFVLIGLLGNLIWRIHPNASAILVDLFTCVKFPVTLLCALYLFKDCSNDVYNVIRLEAKWVTAGLLFLAAMNIFFDFGMGGGGRFGIRSFLFLTDHPTKLTVMATCLTIVFLADGHASLPWVISSLLVVASGLRTKGLVFCASVIILLVVMRRGRRINILHVFMCLILAVVIGWDQYSTQFQSDGYARTELTRASFQIAADYFPLGTGFATFGSYVSGNNGNYSSLYYSYDLAHVWGLAPGEATFLSDTFWPTVIGQFGYLGLVFYCLLLGSLFVLSYSMAGARRIAVIASFAYLIVSSTSESAFFHPLAVTLAFCLALVSSGGSTTSEWSAKSSALLNNHSNERQ